MSEITLPSTSRAEVIPMNISSPRNTTVLLRLSTIAVAVSGALWVTPVVAAVEDACLPSIGGLGGLPVIDGVVDTDPTATDLTDVGWNGATRLLLKSESGTARASVLQLGMTSTDIYIGGVVDAPIVAETDRIVLGFSSDPSPTGGSTDWRIIIQPFNAADAGATTTFKGRTLDPGRVRYWRDSATWTTAAPATASAADWMVTGFAYARNGTSWSFEVKIPRAASAAAAGPGTGIYFSPSPTPFRFYYAALATNVFFETVNQTNWPKSTLFVPADDTQIFDTQIMPAQAQWGALSVFDRPECNGVFLRNQDIGVVDPADGTGQNIVQNIRRIADASITQTSAAQCDALADNQSWPGTQGPVNTFVARPSNSGANAQISATFRIADWGLPGPGQWVKVGSPAAPEPVNPTLQQLIAANNNVPPNPAATRLTMDWRASYKQSCQYKFHSHQCIHVDLDSTDTTTTRIKTKSVERNMNFVGASQVIDEATVGTVGYAAPPSGRAAHGFALDVVSDVLSGSREKALAGSGVLPPKCSATDPAAATDPSCCAEQPGATTSTMSTAHSHHTATLLPDGKVLVAGNRGAEWNGSNVTELYDPATNAWARGPNLNRARFDQAAILSKASELLLIGGGNDDRNSEMAQSTDIFFLEKRAWVGGPPLKMPYFAPNAVTLPNGTILATSDNWYDTSIFSPTAREWSAGPRLSKLHGGGRLLLLQDGRALYVGGSDIAELFELKEKRWIPTGPVNAARSGHTATLLKNGKVLVTGGFVNEPEREGRSARSAELFDPATNSWTRIPDMASARRVHTATLLPNGRVLIAGGNGDNQSDNRTSSSTEIYDPATNAWTAGPPLATGRLFHTATLLADGSVLLVGGDTAGGSAERHVPGSAGKACGANAARDGSGAVALAASTYKTLRWTVTGRRRTGRFISIAGKKFEYAEDVGSYGVFARHFVAPATPPDAPAGVIWGSALEGGAALKTLLAPKEATESTPGYGFYAIDILPGQSARIRGVIEAKETAPPPDDCRVVIGNIICCPIQSTTTTALPAPKEYKLAGGLLVALLALRRAFRRRNTDTRSL